MSCFHFYPNPEVVEIISKIHSQNIFGILHTYILLYIIEMYTIVSKFLSSLKVQWVVSSITSYADSSHCMGKIIDGFCTNSSITCRCRHWWINLSLTFKDVLFIDVITVKLETRDSRQYSQNRGKVSALRTHML